MNNKANISQITTAGTSDDSLYGYCLYPGATDINAIDAAVSGHMQQTLYCLGFGSKWDFAGQIGGAPPEASAPTVGEIPNPPTSIPNAGNTGKYAIGKSPNNGKHLTKAQFQAYVAQAYPQAAVGRWKNMPNWSTNDALATLVHWESEGFQPMINSSAHAYGLFQFLQPPNRLNTWSDVGLKFGPGTASSINDSQAIIYQCIGGLRYIYETYGTPDRAWAFERSTIEKNPNIAPR